MIKLRETRKESLMTVRKIAAKKPKVRIRYGPEPSLDWLNDSPSPPHLRISHICSMSEPTDLPLAKDKKRKGKKKK